jgi:carboxyl-terminal processing protease
MELGDGSAVRLTIARYYTPTGRSIQKSYEMGNEAYFNDYILRYKNGEMTNGDSIHVSDSLRYETPGGKIVYGGGGIIPDIFVAKDTNMERENITYVLRIGLFSRFVFEELEKNRSFYNALSWKEFYKGAIVTDKTVDNFLSYMKSQNVPMKVDNYQPLLKKYIKAVMAEQLFGTNEFQRIINENDRIIDKVMELSLTN